MVTHHTASLITASACGTSIARAAASRCAASAIAVTDQPSAASPVGGPPVCSLFQARRQMAEQNRSCSRRGSKTVPQWSQFRRSAIPSSYARIPGGGSAPRRRPALAASAHRRPCARPGRLVRSHRPWSHWPVAVTRGAGTGAGSGADASACRMSSVTVSSDIAVESMTR